jgi:methionyl-tRNA synthetase|tara:strand:+ start:192 stop:455 length:264 start_codon:yes stop_codon:yes gene_type:complete
MFGVDYFGTNGIGVLALPTVFYFLVFWEAIWKGIGLWKCGRNKQLSWFIAIFVLNTAGILPIIYLLFFRKDKAISYDRKGRRVRKKK